MNNWGQSEQTGLVLKRIQRPSGDTALQRLDINVAFKRESKQIYPIPKGDSAYSKAKRAEYIDKNLRNAEKYYMLAIETNDRTESAIKDLAGVMHQQGKTAEAIEFLKDHHACFNDRLKYENLLMNLKRQVVQRGNRLNKHLKISNLPSRCERSYIAHLFAKPERIISIDIHMEPASTYAIVKFPSHSAARKTLESFSHFDSFKVEWFSITGDVAGDVLSTKSDTKKEKPVFSFKVFSRDFDNKALVMPVCQDVIGLVESISEEKAESLLGKSIYSQIS